MYGLHGGAWVWRHHSRWGLRRRDAGEGPTHAQQGRVQPFLRELSGRDELACQGLADGAGRQPHAEGGAPPPEQQRAEVRQSPCENGWVCAWLRLSFL